MKLDEEQSLGSKDFQTKGTKNFDVCAFVCHGIGSVIYVWVDNIVLQILQS